MGDIVDGNSFRRGQLEVAKVVRPLTRSAFGEETAERASHVTTEDAAGLAPLVRLKTTVQSRQKRRR